MILKFIKDLSTQTTQILSDIMSNKLNARTTISDSMQCDTVIRSTMICLRPRNIPVLRVKIHPGQWVIQNGIENIWEICELRQDY